MTFQFLPSPVKRILIDPVKDEFDPPIAKRMTILLAVVICQRCSRKSRLLGSPVIARKHYGVRVIEHFVTRYSRGQEGLRRGAVSIYEDTPPFTTRHEWTRGLGAHDRFRPRATPRDPVAGVARGRA